MSGSFRFVLKPTKEEPDDGSFLADVVGHLAVILGAAPTKIVSEDKETGVHDFHVVKQGHYWIDDGKYHLEDGNNFWMSRVGNDAEGNAIWEVRARYADQIVMDAIQTLLVRRYLGSLKSVVPERV